MYLQHFTAQYLFDKTNETAGSQQYFDSKHGNITKYFAKPNGTLLGTI